MKPIMGAISIAVLIFFALGCGAKNDGSDAVIKKYVEVLDEHTTAIEGGLTWEQDHEYEQRTYKVLLVDLANLFLADEDRRRSLQRHKDIISAAEERHRVARAARDKKSTADRR